MNNQDKQKQRTKIKLKLRISITISLLFHADFNGIFWERGYRRLLQKHADDMTAGSRHDKGLNAKFTGHGSVSLTKI